MKAVKLLSVFIFGILLTSSAYAKDLKIAYVELGGVFNNYQKTKDYDVTLQKESQDAQKQIEQMISKIRDDQGKLALLKEDEKQKLQTSIDKAKLDLLDFQKQKRTELAKKFEDMRNQIVLEIEKIVSDIAKKESYTYIFNDTAILYADKETNITAQVLKVLNDSYPAKK
ncbi:MAG: OmpH family outer membrane protein [Candidatus Omnitrophota bacterium]